MAAARCRIGAFEDQRVDGVLIGQFAAIDLAKPHIRAGEDQMMEAAGQPQRQCVFERLAGPGGKSAAGFGVAFQKGELRAHHPCSAGRPVLGGMIGLPADRLCHILPIHDSFHTVALSGPLP